ILATVGENYFNYQRGRFPIGRYNKKSRTRILDTFDAFNNEFLGRARGFARGGRVSTQTLRALRLAESQQLAEAPKGLLKGLRGFDGIDLSKYVSRLYFYNYKGKRPDFNLFK